MALQLNQAIALFNAGRAVEAEAGTRRITKSHPDTGLAWKILGFCLLMQGKDALSALQKAASLLPADMELHNQLGVVLTAQGKLHEAEATFLRALKINPAQTEILYNLNVAYMAQGRLPDAQNALRQAIAIKPDYAMAYYGLGLALKAEGKLQEAESHLLRALEIKPDFAGGHYCLGYQYMVQGRSQNAEARFRKAVALDPNYSEARLKLGVCLSEQGRFAEAGDCYRQILASNPEDIETRFNLAQIGKANEGDENLAMLLEIERNKGNALTDQDAAMLNFALGKGLDDCGHHETAFAHFLTGARRKRATLDYSPEQTSASFAEVAHIFNASTLEKLRGSGNPSALPVFILGMPRSGTTLIEQIIASHPEVHGTGELPDLLEIATSVIGGGDTKFPQALHELTPEYLTSMGNEYVSRLQRHSPDSLRITDKMPVNFVAVGLIHLILPNAKIIHVRRNPLDTCVSCFTQLFQGRMDFSYDLEELGRYYLDYLRLMEHWRKVLPNGAFIEVNYEDVVSDQETQTRRLIEYCGLKWDDACMNFQNNGRSVRTASIAQVRRPIYRSSMERWRRYEQHLGPLLDILGEIAPNR
ncbi:MAG: sulfotransferase [Gallionella sp.]